MRSLVLLALAVGFAASCIRDVDRPPSPTYLRNPQSFTVHGMLNADLSTGAQDFTLRLDPGHRAMIVGLPGRAMTVPVVSSDGVSFRAGSPVVLPVPNTGCGSQATYSDFHFIAGTDSISGTATGIADLTQGDLAFQKKAQLDFHGLPDVTVPSILADSAEADPLAVVTFVASEPLSVATRAQLISPGEQIPLALLSSDGNVTVGFQRPPAALRYDTRYKLAIDNWTDLAGNPGPPLDEIITYPPPQLIPPDGFESANDSLPGATIADATVFPPISGERSALVGYPTVGYSQSARFTVRLAVAAGDRVVRFSLREFIPNGFPGGLNTQLRLAAPGGAIASVPLTQLSGGTDQVLPNGMHVTAGPVTAIEAPLPEGVGNEVVFDLQTGIINPGCTLPLPVPGYQIDDLRVA